MTQHYTKQWLLALFLALWMPMLAPAQNINSLSPTSLPYGTYITGLYHIEADDGSNLYVKEQPDGTLITDTFDTEAAGFYFWLAEDAATGTFRIYSASQQKKLLTINTNGSIQWTTDSTLENATLLFRMYPQGPQRTVAHQNVEAIGYITTKTLTTNPGNTDCQCNFLQVGTNTRFKLHNSEAGVNNYRPIAFEKTDIANSNGTVQIDSVTSVTTITQTKPVVGFVLPQNFVSSNFFVKGFGEDDFKITVAPGTEGYIGFLDYTHHHFTKEVYRAARPKIGVRIQNDIISLIYLSGRQPLPFSQDSLGREVVTNFVTGTPFILGFKGQDSLVIAQNGTTYALERAVPAELFLNRSVTQSARMLVRLVEGDVKLSYTSKNRLVNSVNDFGTDNGSNFVSNHVFFPYNKGDTFLNTFDWQQTQWPVRYVGNAGTVTDMVFSPFYSNRTEFSGISARFDPGGNYIGGEDFSASEGWELIKADLGYNANGSSRNQAPAHPYIIFYDRVSGTLRVFVYTNNQGEANQLAVSLSTMGGTPTNQQGYVPKLWGSLQQFTSLDQVQSGAYEKALPFYSASGRDWYFADFVMEYDPCIAFFESTLNLQVYKTTRGDLSMVGRLEGGSFPAGTPEYDNWTNQRQNFLMGVMDNNFGILKNTLGDITFNQLKIFGLLDFKDEVSGVLVGKKIESWEKEKARMEWEATSIEATAQMAAGVAQMTEGGSKFFKTSIPIVDWPSNVVEGSAIMAQGAASIIAGGAKVHLANAQKLYYDNIKDKVKEDDQQLKMEVPPPRPHAVFGELALKGTLTIQTTLVPEAYIATPGGLNSKNAPEWYVNGSRGSRPLYNRPLGKFNLLKQPQFGVGIIQSANAGYSAWLKIKEKPYFVHNNTVLGKIDDIINIAIHVQTLDATGKVIRSSTAGDGYTTLFGLQDGNPLPGAMEITDLVDWEQIDLNIAGMNNPSEQDIENQLGNWIEVSYEAWTLTLTSLKSRSLSRVFANSDQYYKGQGSFAFGSKEIVAVYQLIQEAKDLADNNFSNYNFSDDPDFGTEYHLYHTDYDTGGDSFYTIMNNYCSTLNTAQNTGAKTTGGDPDTKGQEIVATAPDPIPEEPTIVEPGLTVYPNPVQYELNFRLVSQEKGQARITLYDLNGRALISTTDQLDASSTLQGLVNISALPSGFYILKVELPGGKSLSKKVLKK